MSDVGNSGRKGSADRTASEARSRMSGLLWGVGAVSRRTGIASPTLRTWDRRYGLGPSVRTEGGHRRYAESDIAKVVLMSRLTETGVPAQQAATMLHRSDAAQVWAMLESPGAVSVQQPPTLSDRTIAFTVDGIIRAARRLDAVALSRSYAQLLEVHGVVRAWTDILAPAMAKIGCLWQSADLGVESEHLASERLATELHSISRTRRPRRDDHVDVVLAAAPEERHSLPLLALEGALAEKQVRTLALGPCTPSEALVPVLVKLRPRVLFVWASMPATPPAPGPPSTAVLLGGPGWKEPPPAPRVETLAAAVGCITDLVAA